MTQKSSFAALEHSMMISVRLLVTLESRHGPFWNGRDHKTNSECMHHESDKFARGFLQFHEHQGCLASC